MEQIVRSKRRVLLNAQDSSKKSHASLKNKGKSPIDNAAVQQTVIAMASPLYNRLVVRCKSSNTIHMEKNLEYK